MAKAKHCFEERRICDLESKHLLKHQQSGETWLTKYPRQTCRCTVWPPLSAGGVVSSCTYVIVNLTKKPYLTTPLMLSNTIEE